MIEYSKEEMPPVIFTAQTDGKLAPTITSCLIDIIREAETLFGERNKRFSLVGVEFIESDRPQIVFDGLYARIQLTRAAFTDLQEARCQCAHEIIHFLEPLTEGKPTVLEEGVATYFQKIIVPGFYPAIPEYDKASDLVYELLKIDEYAVKKLRESQTVLSKITKKMIMARYSCFCEATAEKLVQPFEIEE